MTPLLPNVIPIHTHILVNCAHLLYIHLYSHRSNMKHSRETFDMKDGMYWTHVPFWSTCTSLEDLEIRTFLFLLHYIPEWNIVLFTPLQLSERQALFKVKHVITIIIIIITIITILIMTNELHLIQRSTKHCWRPNQLFANF